MKKVLDTVPPRSPPDRGKEERMDLEAVRIWKGPSAVEAVHVLGRADGKKEVVIVMEGGAEGIAEWLRKAAALHDAERRRLEDPDGD
jgi:hypothetical protein